MNLDRYSTEYYDEDGKLFSGEPVEATSFDDAKFKLWAAGRHNEFITGKIVAEFPISEKELFNIMMPRFEV